MAIYVTGRTRTLTVAGDITAILRGYAGTAPTYDGDGQCVPGTGIAGNSGISSGYIVSPWGGTVEWVHHDPAFAPLGEYGWELAIMPVAGGTVKTFLVTDPITPPTNITANATGEFTFTVEVEECFEVVDVPPGMVDTIDSRKWVNYGGTGYADGLISEGTQVEYFERIIDGSDMSVTLSWDAGAAGTGSDSQTDVAGASIRLTAYDVITHQEGNVGNYIRSCSIEYDFLESIGPNYVDTENGTYYSNRGTYSYTPGTRKMLAKLDLGYLGSVVTDFCDLATATAYGNGQLDADIYPVKRYALEGRTRAFDQPFPNLLGVYWVDKALYPLENEKLITGTGSFSDSSVQHEYLTDMLLMGVSKSAPTLLEYAAPRCWIDPTSLTLTGDDSRDWRLMIRGKPYLSHTIKHEPSTIVENGSSATGWTAGASTTVTSASGAIHMVAAGGVGSGYKTWAAPLNAEGYRFMKIRLRSVVNASQDLFLTFTVPSDAACTESKVYKVTTGAANTYTDVTIDLCLNEFRAVTVEGTESHWPRTTLVGVPVNSPDFWGLNVLDKMLVSGIADGETIDIDSIELVRTTETPLNSWLPSFYNWQLAFDDGVGRGNQKAFWWGDVAGRVTGNTDCYQIEGTPNSYTPLSLTNLKTEIDSIEGYTVTVAGSFPADGFHDNSQPAHWAFGAGIVYRDSDWHYGVDVDVSTDFDVYAQALWDRVTVYPACGDCWESPAYGALDEPTPIRFGKHLRAQAWGVAFDTAAPVPSVSPYLWTDPGNIARGSGTTDLLGYFKTGLTFGRGNLNHKVSFVATETVNVVLKHPVVNRMRHRAILAAAVAEMGGVWNVWSGDGLYWQVQSATAGGVSVFRRTFGPSSSAGVDPITVIPAGKEGRIFLDHHDTGGLNVVYRDGTDAKLVASLTDGEDWTAGMVVLSNVYFITGNSTGNPARTLVVAGFRYDSGTSGPGTIVYKIMQPDSTTFGSELDVTGISFEPEFFHIFPASDDLGGWNLAAKVYGETGAALFVSTDDLLTWLRVT